MLTIKVKRCKEIMKFDYICYHLVFIRNLSGNFLSDRANRLSIYATELQAGHRPYLV